MKTTVEVPDPTFRRAKVLAAGFGMTLKQFFTEALEEKLRRCAHTPVHARDAPWMAGFGALSDLSDENERLLGVIEEEFEIFTPEDPA